MASKPMISPGKTALVVDDTDYMRSAAELTLKRLVGFTNVLTAADRMQAIQILAEIMQTRDQLPSFPPENPADAEEVLQEIARVRREVGPTHVDLVWSDKCMPDGPLDASTSGVRLLNQIPKDFPGLVSAQLLCSGTLDRRDPERLPVDTKCFEKGATIPADIVAFLQERGVAVSAEKAQAMLDEMGKSDS